MNSIWIRYYTNTETNTIYNYTAKHADCKIPSSMMVLSNKFVCKENYAPNNFRSFERVPCL